MHRFYLEPACFSEEKVIWDAKDSRHICRVLRLEAGNQVTAFDGTGWEYEVLLESVQPEQVTGKILKKTAVDREVPVHLELVQGVAKADKMDWIVQKAVEAGVSAVQPLLTRYTVVKLEKGKQEAKRRRWESIAREACKQCRRNTVPLIHEVKDWENFLVSLDTERLYLLFYEDTKNGDSLKSILRREKKEIFSHGISILIGPEGGWSPEEVEAARSHGVYIDGLGPRILRTETAGLVAAAAILYEMDALE